MEKGYIRVVYQDVDFLEFNWQVAHELTDLLDIAYIELHNMHFHAFREPLDFFLDSLQCILTSSCEDKLQIVWLRARKFQCGALADSGAGAGNEDGFAGEAFSLT